MAVDVRKLIYDLQLKLNAVNSGRANDYRVLDLVTAINRAYERLVEFLVLSKDQNETIRNHLRPLIRSKVYDSFEKQKLEYKIEYPEDFYEILYIDVEVKCSSCEGLNKTITVTKPQGDDLGEAKLNPYRQANFYFEQLPCYENNKGLTFYTNDKLDLEKVNLVYYKKVKRVEAPSLVLDSEGEYERWDGEKVTSNIDFEIDSTYINESVTDLAAYFLMNSSKDFTSASQKINEILQINQIYK